MSPRWEKQSDLWAQVAFYSALGFIVPAGLVVGYALGWFLDRWLHTTPLLAVVMAFLGAGGGIVEILQILKRAEKRANRNDSSTGVGPS